VVIRGGRGGARLGRALALPDQLSIAVLPFVNLSGDPEQEYFNDGITDDLTTDLSRLPGLFVIARNSSFTYKGKSAKLQDVGNELGVKYVLQGSVRKAGGAVRVTVQLADVRARGGVVGRGLRPADARHLPAAR
jgi:adenylate cyclase